MALFRVRPMRPRDRLQWDPWRETEELRRELERITERGAGSPVGGDAARMGFIPPVDLYDGGAAFMVKLDLPGVRPEDLDISIEGSRLAVRGRRVDDEANEESYLHRERSAGQFERAIELPASIEAGTVKATLRRGVLEIVLPKSEAAVPPTVHVSVGEGD